MATIDRRAIYERDGGLCGFCGEPVPLTEFEIDHVPPRGLGLPTQHLRVSHRLCNRRAGWDVRRERRREIDALTGVASIRIPPELLEKLRTIADSEDRSLNAQIVRALREWLVLHGND